MSRKSYGTQDNHFLEETNIILMEKNSFGCITGIDSIVTYAYAVNKKTQFFYCGSHVNHQKKITIAQEKSLFKNLSG